MSSWTDSLLAQGRYGFSLTELKSTYPYLSAAALKFALKRLVDKNKSLSIFKGYYLIIPPQYATKGILPPYLYLDTFMKYLNRPYYVSLLNAAAFHGASHQQPQEYFVMTRFPVLRPTQKKGLNINYISIKAIPETLLEKRKTEAGYLTISNPALTACDLLQYAKRIGGLHRAATVLSELAEVLKPADFNTDLLRYTHITTLQRLGYLLESIAPELAEALYHATQQQKLTFFRIPLTLWEKSNGYPANKRWKVIVNITIETDE